MSGNWAYVDLLSYTDLGQPWKYTYGSSAEPVWTADSYDEQTGTTPITVDDQNYSYDRPDHLRRRPSRQTWAPKPKQSPSWRNSASEPRLSPASVEAP